MLTMYYIGLAAILGLVGIGYFAFNQNEQVVEDPHWCFEKTYAHMGEYRLEAPGTFYLLELEGRQVHAYRRCNT